MGSQAGRHDRASDRVGLGQRYVAAASASSIAA
jgi:hypothetical protein